MKLIEKIKTDMISSMKNKDEIKKELLRVVLTDCTKQSKEPDDIFVEKEIRKMLKNLEENLTKSNDPIFVDNTKIEISILNTYLPKLMDDSEIELFLKDYLSKTDERNFGKLMGLCSKELSGKADNRKVSEILKKLIQ